MLPHDPRLKGFGDRATLMEVWGWIDAACAPLPSEQLDAAACVGRVPAHDVVAAHPLPPGPVAAVDGVAVRAEDTFGANAYNPLLLQLLGAGDAVIPGTAVPVVLGHPVPEGADAVLGYDAAETAGGMVEVLGQLAPGENVVQAGQDAGAGDVLLPAGRRVTGSDCALAIQAGVKSLAVRAVPRVRLISAGRPLAADLAPMVLGDAIVRDGGRVVDHAAVDRDGLADVLRRTGADLIVIVGASGLGLEDRAALVLADTGILDCHGLAVRPGETAGFGRMGHVPVLLLPGSPGACRLVWEVVGSRALRRLAGLPVQRGRRGARLAHKVTSEPGWTELLPVRIADDGTVSVTVRGAIGLAALARSDAYILVPTDGEGYPAGAEVSICLFNGD